MRTRFLRWLVRLAMQRRRTVLVTTIVTTLVAFGLSGLLKMNFQWSYLLPESLPLVQEFKRVDEEFKNPGNLLVVVEGDDPVELERATDDVIEIVRGQSEWISLVYGRVPESFMLEHGLRTLKPKDLQRSVDRLRDPRLVPFITHVNDDLERDVIDEEYVRNNERDVVAGLDAIEALVETLALAADGDVDDARTARTVRDLTTGSPYFFSLDKKMTIVMAGPTFGMDAFDKFVPTDHAVEDALLSLADKYPNVRFRRTGMISIGRAEMESVGPQTMVLTLLALLLVFFMLRWNFGDWWTPVLGLLPIVVGVIWAMGFYAVTVQTLNLMTVMIMLVLIGLGIDFSIHVMNRFREARAGGAGLESALEDALVGTGRGVLTGAVTSAVAFLAIMVSDTRGITEFGFCAGTGVLISLAAVLFTLPSLLVWREVRVQEKAREIRAPQMPVLGALSRGMIRLRAVVLPLALVTGALGVWASQEIAWEYNFLNLEPQVDAVLLQRELVDRYRMSPEMSSVTVDTVAESRMLADAFKKKKVVSGVDSISYWLPDPGWIEENDALVGKLRAMYADMPDEIPPPDPAKLVEQVRRLSDNMLELEELSFIGGQDRVVEKLERLTGGEARDGPLPKLAASLERAERIEGAKLGTLAAAFVKAARPRIATMAAGSGPVTEEMLPPEILARYRSAETGRYLVQIYPRGYVYDSEPLERFNTAVFKVHANVTGTPQLILEMFRTMLADGGKAVLAAALAIFLLLLLDFRRPVPALLAMVPLAIGTAWMLAVVWLIGMKYNYVNLIAIPVIIGIGVDDGVHFLHRYLESGGQKVDVAMSGVGRAIVMTSLTTMIGFGSIAFYEMPGMASVGILLFIGVGACLLSTLLVMPGLVTLFAPLLKKRMDVFRQETERKAA